MKTSRNYTSRDGIKCAGISALAAANIKRVMMERKILLTELAKQSSLSKGSLSTYFSGKRTLTLRSLEKIAIALNLQPHLLIQDVGVHRNGRRRSVWWGKPHEALGVKEFLKENKFLDSINQKSLQRDGAKKLEVKINRQRFKPGLGMYRSS